MSVKHGGFKAHHDGGKWIVDYFDAQDCDNLEFVVRLIDPASGYVFPKTEDGEICDSFGIVYYRWPEVMDGVWYMEAPEGIPAVDDTLWIDRYNHKYYWGNDNLLHPYRGSIRLQDRERTRKTCGSLRAEGFHLFVREAAYLLFGRVDQDALGCPAIQVRAVAWTWGNGGEYEEFKMDDLIETLSSLSMRIVKGQEEMAVLAVLDAAYWLAKRDKDTRRFVFEIGNLLKSRYQDLREEVKEVREQQCVTM